MIPADFELGAGGAWLVPTIGEPIHQIKAPLLLNAHFRRTALNAIAFPLHVPSPQLACALEMLRSCTNIAGFTVTVPHKETVIPFLDELLPRARRAGAVNIVARDSDGRLRGDMVDGLGFIADIESRGVSLRDKRVVLVGTGGAGRALIAALCDCGLESLWATDRDPTRAASAVCIMGARAQAGTLDEISAQIASADVAINASTAGLSDGDPLPMMLDRASPHVFVADINVRPGGTALEHEARRRSLQFMDGSGMLQQQIGLFLSFFGLAR